MQAKKKVVGWGREEDRGLSVGERGDRRRRRRGIRPNLGGEVGGGVRTVDVAEGGVSGRRGGAACVGSAASATREGLRQCVSVVAIFFSRFVSDRVHSHLIGLYEPFIQLLALFSWVGMGWKAFLSE